MKTLLATLLVCLPAAAAAAEKEQVRYLKPAGDKFVQECEFTLEHADTGSSITSVTGRGNTQMTVTARYDAKDNLTVASVSLKMGETTQKATVEVADGKWKVKREGQEVQELTALPRVIVTSAPDWTDCFSLCREYDLVQGGEQQFPGLWIHPTQKALSLKFTIERVGVDAIEHNGKKLELERFRIRIRGNSMYAAWADSKGKMIKLTPLPYKPEAKNWLVLEGFEKSAAGLKPGE